MARIVITRPNGATEYAELTTDKNLAGNDRLTVEKTGTVYYAKLGNGVSTHMYVIQPDGRKLYVQKEVKFVWKYTFDNTWENASKMVIPRTGKYKITYTDDETNIFGGTEILKSGDKLLKDRWGWYIQGKGDSHYYNVNVMTHEDNPDIPENVEETYYLDTIEYIGEA